MNQTKNTTRNTEVLNTQIIMIGKHSSIVSTLCGSKWEAQTKVTEVSINEP